MIKQKVNYKTLKVYKYNNVNLDNKGAQSPYCHFKGVSKTEKLKPYDYGPYV